MTVEKAYGVFQYRYGLACYSGKVHLFGSDISCELHSEAEDYFDTVMESSFSALDALVQDEAVWKDRMEEFLGGDAHIYLIKCKGSEINMTCHAGTSLLYVKANVNEGILGKYFLD